MVRAYVNGPSMIRCDNRQPELGGEERGDGIGAKGGYDEALL